MKDGTSKIKIVFGMNDFLVGGTQKQFSQLVKYLDKEKFDITLVTLFDFPEKENLYDFLPRDLRIENLSFKGWNDFGSWMELSKLLKNIGPDIVVSSLFFSNTVFRALKIFHGFVCVAREHNTYIHKKKFHQFVDRVLARTSAKVVAVSQTVADFTSSQEDIPLEKFEVIRNGIDINEFEQKLENLPSKVEIRNELGFEPLDKVFLNVARLTPQKNHKLLVDAFSEISKNYPDYKLLIVGDGPLLDKLKAQAQKENSSVEKIIFTGYKSDVSKYYKASDFFISTSLIEGLSNAYLEAQVVGLPIIATRTAGTDELVKEGENGFFIENKNVAEAVERATKANYSNLQENSRKIIQDFGIKKTAREYEELFESVI